MQIIKRGAEAILYKENSKLIKERIKKGYRIKEIDSILRKQRTKNETKLLSEARRTGVETPKVFSFDNYKIKMEFIDGELIKDILNKKTELALEIGKNIGLLHSHRIVHGDLTTSNMILRNNKIYFIDFGLGFISDRIEDFAVDLAVLKEALKSTHYKYLNKLWQNITKGYKETNKKAKEILKRLEEIEKRGRYVKR